MPLAPRVATPRRALVLGTFVTASVVSIPSSWAGTIVSNVADGILTVTGTRMPTTSPFGAKAAISP